MAERDISDKKITKTLIVSDLMTGSDIGTWQADFLLREVDFERLKNGKPLTSNWASGIFLTTIGFGLNLLAKAYSDDVVITFGEWLALLSGITLAIIIYAIGRVFLKDSRKLVMEKIEKHFESAPTKRSIVGDDHV